MFKAKILADSLHPEGSRLVTMELTYPRCIHSEFMTHRQFSRNAASSRAIPIKKMMDDVHDNPFVPIVWGMNQSGMQAGGEHPHPGSCKGEWLSARDYALNHARELNDLGLHKQIVNRVLEPWMWITVIATGVDHAWENFFKLRCHPDAEPHIQKIAYMSRDMYDNGEPKQLGSRNGDHHLPLIGFEGDDELKHPERSKVSVARCARVSYLTHDGKRDIKADLELYDRLRDGGHWSPFEHVAQVDISEKGTSNFGAPWTQYRKKYTGEYCRKAPR